MAKKQLSKLQYIKRLFRNFLRINNSREFLVFLLFLLVSFIIWYLTTMRGEYEMEYSPKLRLKNVPEDMIVIEPLPEQIDVVLKDKGDELLKYKARRSFKEVVIDYRQYSNMAGRTAIYGRELAKLIGAQLSSSTQLVSLSLDTLQFYVASARGVKVPVRVNGRIEADNQHAIQRVNIIPDSVTVYATEAYLDTLKAVSTPKVNHVGLSDSLNQTLTLGGGRHGIKYEPAEVMLHVAVSPYVTKMLEVPIEGYLFPFGMSLKTFPSKAKVTFRVSLEDYGWVSEKDFVLQVHYTQIQDNPLGKVSPRLAIQPSCVHNVKIEPSEVDYLVEVNALPSPYNPSIP